MHLRPYWGPHPAQIFWVFFFNFYSRHSKSSGKMGLIDQNRGAKYGHFYLGKLKNHKITHLLPHFTMCTSINRVQLKIYQFSNLMFDPTTHSECVTNLRDETQISNETNMGWLRFYSEDLSNNLAGGGSAPTIHCIRFETFLDFHEPHLLAPSGALIAIPTY